MNGPPRFWPTAIAVLVGIAFFTLDVWWPRLKRLIRKLRDQ